MPIAVQKAKQAPAPVPDNLPARLSFIHMFSERQGEDADDDLVELYMRNPEALAFYARGVHDFVTLMQAMFDQRVDPELVARVMEEMGKQSKLDMKFTPAANDTSH